MLQYFISGSKVGRTDQENSFPMRAPGNYSEIFQKWRYMWKKEN